jgi:hypothetical protein
MWWSSIEVAVTWYIVILGDTTRVLPLSYVSYQSTKEWAITKGRRFFDATNIIKDATEELKRRSQNGFQECFQHLYSPWQKCLIAQGDYFEGNGLNDCTVEYLSDREWLRTHCEATKYFWTRKYNVCGHNEQMFLILGLAVLKVTTNLWIFALFYTIISILIIPWTHFVWLRKWSISFHVMINLILQNIGHCLNVQNLSTLLADCVYVFHLIFKVDSELFL